MGVLIHHKIHSLSDNWDRWIFSKWSYGCSIEQFTNWKSPWTLKYCWCKWWLWKNYTVRWYQHEQLDSSNIHAWAMPIWSLSVEFLDEFARHENNNPMTGDMTHSLFERKMQSMGNSSTEAVRFQKNITRATKETQRKVH